MCPPIPLTQAPTATSICRRSMQLVGGFTEELYFRMLREKRISLAVLKGSEREVIIVLDVPHRINVPKPYRKRDITDRWEVRLVGATFLVTGATLATWFLNRRHKVKSHAFDTVDSAGFEEIIGRCSQGRVFVNKSTMVVFKTSKKQEQSSLDIIKAEMDVIASDPGLYVPLVHHELVNFRYQGQEMHGYSMKYIEFGTIKDWWWSMSPENRTGLWNTVMMEIVNLFLKATSHIDRQLHCDIASRNVMVKSENPLQLCLIDPDLDPKRKQCSVDKVQNGFVEILIELFVDRDFYNFWPNLVVYYDGQQKYNFHATFIRALISQFNPSGWKNLGHYDSDKVSFGQHLKIGNLENLIERCVYFGSFETNPLKLDEKYTYATQTLTYPNKVNNYETKNVLFEIRKHDPIITVLKSMCTEQMKKNNENVHVKEREWKRNEITIATINVSGAQEPNEAAILKREVAKAMPDVVVLRERLVPAIEIHGYTTVILGEPEKNTLGIMIRTDSIWKVKKSSVNFCETNAAVIVTIADKEGDVTNFKIINIRVCDLEPDKSSIQTKTSEQINEIKTEILIPTDVDIVLGDFNVNMNHFVAGIPSHPQVHGSTDIQNFHEVPVDPPTSSKIALGKIWYKSDNMRLVTHGVLEMTAITDRYTRLGTSDHNGAYTTGVYATFEYNLSSDN